MQHLRKAGFVAALLGTFVLGGFIIPDADDQSGAELFRDVLTLVSTRFVDTLDVSEVYERAAEGLIERLEDPYAALFSPEELEEFIGKQIRLQADEQYGQEQYDVVLL